jgi:hypothetical protein
MPSKGLSVYSYIGVPGPFTVEFSVPGPNGTIVNTSADNFGVKSLEIESHNIAGLRNFTGRFQWRVLRDGVEVASKFNDINTFTGNLAGGEMLSTQHFTPIKFEDVIIAYGFYDAGHGEAGLTNRDQCYITICSDHSSWMGTVAPPGSPEAQQPFSKFVLAAPHDDGMCSMQNADAVLAAADPTMVNKLMEELPRLHFFNHLPVDAIAHLLPNIVYTLSVTQKKEISMMLAVGARYFEFRPAMLHPIFEEVSHLPQKYYFQHACIPGVAFDDFLEDQVEFLDAHPTEIVVIHIRFDNIVAACKKPTNEDIFKILTEACSKAKNAPLAWGQRECFSRSIDSLRNDGTRLICVILAEKYDSWTAEAYATLNADPIIKQFESMNTEGQESTDLTVLQCQATSQSIKEVAVYSVLSSNAATSCLTSTKAMLNKTTLPWIREHALERLKADRTIVIMNDFIDGATTDTSVMLSRRRLEMQ